MTARIPNTREERITLWTGISLLTIGVLSPMLIGATWVAILLCVLGCFSGGLFMGTAAEARANRIAMARFVESERLARSSKRGWN